MVVSTADLIERFHTLSDRARSEPVTTTTEEAGRRRAYVLPTTHSQPVVEGDGVEIPDVTKKGSGLDGDRSRIVATEANVFERPGPDLRVLPRGTSGRAVHGSLPPSLFRVVRDRFVTLARERRIGLVPRSEAEGPGS